LCKSRWGDAGRVEWKFAEIDSILRNAESSIAIVRRACDESSYRLHECSGSAPRDVSARAVHPQLGPGGIAGPPGEDARLADQRLRVLPRCAFERRPRPRRDRAETLRVRRVGGGAVYSERERAALALTDAVTRITEGHVPDAVFERARAHFNERDLTALVFTPDHHQRLEPPRYHDAH
jgi:hypothetical protein